MALIDLGPSSQVGIEVREGVVILELIGRLEGHDGEAAFPELVEARLLEGRRKFLFKCGRLELVNSRGLGSLLQALGMISKSGGCWRFCRVNMRISHCFDASDRGLFNIVESCEQALKELIQEPDSRRG